MRSLRVAAVALSLCGLSCVDGHVEIDPCGSASAPMTCTERTRDDAYYVDQALRYFDTYDVTIDRHPTYAEHVARWEWPPWLRLTGYGSDLIENVDALVVSTMPTVVTNRDCRAFDEQPYARCRVSFQYDGGPCPIYEEFVFNDAGEITWIEAWSDQPGLLPMADPEADPWGEGEDVNRLSARVPGLGTETGYIDPAGPIMAAAAANDPEIADLSERMQFFWTSWFREFRAIGGTSEGDIYGPGCGW